MKGKECCIVLGYMAIQIYFVNDIYPIVLSAQLDIAHGGAELQLISDNDI